MSSKKELEALNQFKLKTADVYDELPKYFQTDTMMLTWLKARDLNVPKADEMLRKSIEWRKSQNFYNMSSWDPPKSFSEEFYYEVTGFTSQKYPIVVVPFGKWNVKKTIESGDKEDWLKYINKIFATIVNLVESKSVFPDKIVSQFCIIVDMEGFTMRQLKSVDCVDAVLECARRFEANFPETLYLAQVVNAPRIFSLLFALIKPILSAHTQSKVKIHGSNAKKWIPALLKTLPADQLPGKYGGTLKSNAMLLATEVDGLPKDTGDELIAVSVPAGEKLQLDFNIKNSGTQLSWSFRTDTYDIGFSVLFEGKEELQKLALYNSHEKKEEGFLICSNPGKYSLVFDNSHSRMRSKCLYYIAETSEDTEDYNDGEAEDTQL